MDHEGRASEAFAGFVRSFGAGMPEFHIISDEFYRKDAQLISISESISRSINRNPSSVSLYYGRYDKRSKAFTPGFPLLEHVFRDSKSRVMVNEKGEWLFLCRRNILESSILNTDELKAIISQKSDQDKPFFVVNRHQELLGTGIITMNKGSIVVKNIIDRGNFLRRERR